MNKEEIKKILPHREPMLLVENVEIENGESKVAVGTYKIKGDEFFLQGHFPGNPVVPGVILCEMLAQTCCALLAGSMDADKTPYFTKLNNVKFRRPVKPGETLQSKCTITRVKEPFYFAQGTGTVNGEVAVSAEFAFALSDK